MFSFSLDSRLLPTGWHSEAQVARASDETIVHKLPSSGSVYSVAFSPDGQVVATGDDAGDLELWSITDVELLAHYDEETGLGAGDGDVRSTANSTDGKFMYYGRGGQRRGRDKPEDPRNEPECRKLH